MKTPDQLAEEAAEKISEWEAKTYGKPSYAFPSQRMEVEVITAIIKSVIEEATKQQREQVNHTQRLIGLTKLSRYYAWPNVAHQPTNELERTNDG